VSSPTVPPTNDLDARARAPSQSGPTPA
jgi:hypothetical protein